MKMQVTSEGVEEEQLTQSHSTKQRPPRPGSALYYVCLTTGVPPGTEVRGPFQGHWPQKEARTRAGNPSSETGSR